MALCIECSIPDWDASVSDALCREGRWPWSSPYIVVTPTWCNSHAVLRFERSAPSHATEVWAHCSLHVSDQLYPHTSQTQPRSPIKSLRHCGLGEAVVVQAVNYAVRMALCIECSPAVQEIPGLIPDGDASVSDAEYVGGPGQALKPLQVNKSESAKIK